MNAIILSNTTEADADNLEVPVHDDGAPYRFEMIFNGLVDRAYADTAEDLLDCLIRGYGSQTPAERLAARLAHAVRTQTTVQADINWQHNNLTDCTAQEVTVLTASRATPPTIGTWSSEVPIVLVDLFYLPLGSLPSPTSTIADVEDPPNIFWLRVEDETAYLLSLASVGHIDLHSHADYEA